LREDFNLSPPQSFAYWTDKWEAQHITAHLQ
jgi:hypothetical protein